MTMQRRYFFRYSGAIAINVLGLNLLTGCNAMNNKKPISDFGKTYEYLKNPDLRTKETGNVLLTIENAQVFGTPFDGIIWSNIHFKNCDFGGAYQIKLDRLENCLFEDCSIAGIIGWGDESKVRYLRCKVVGESYITGDVSSKDVLYEQCEFIGKSNDRNHFGAIGNYGEVTFKDCKAQWFIFRGAKKLSIVNCDMQDPVISTDSFNNSGTNFLISEVTIEKSTFRGNTRMINAQMQSLTIRDTSIDNLDLSNAMIKGDVLFENVTGGSVKAFINGAPNVAIKNSKFTPNSSGVFKFQITTSLTQSALIDNVTISGGEKSVEFGFTRLAIAGEPDDAPRRLTHEIIFRNSKISALDASYLYTSNLAVNSCTFTTADFSKSRIGKLEIAGTTISQKLDFTDTQAKVQNVQLVAGGKNGRVDVMAGSNITLLEH